MNDSERSQSFVDISPVYHQPLFHITSNFLQCQTPCSSSAVTDIGSCGSNSRKRQCLTQPECSACSPSTSILAFMNPSPCKLPLFAVVLSNTWHPTSWLGRHTVCVCTGAGKRHGAAYVLRPNAMVSAGLEGVRLEARKKREAAVSYSIGAFLYDGQVAVHRLA